MNLTLSLSAAILLKIVMQNKKKKGQMKSDRRTPITP